MGVNTQLLPGRVISRGFPVVLCRAMDVSHFAKSATSFPIGFPRGFRRVTNGIERSVPGRTGRLSHKPQFRNAKQSGQQLRGRPTPQSFTVALEVFGVADLSKSPGLHEVRETSPLSTKRTTTDRAADRPFKPTRRRSSAPSAVWDKSRCSSAACASAHRRWPARRAQAWG